MSLMSMTNHALGYLDLFSSGMTIPSYLTSEMHLQNSNFQSWIVNFRAEVCAKAQKEKGENILVPSGRLKNVFSGRQLGLVLEETLVVFYTCMPRETVRTTLNEVQIRKKSDLEQAYSSVPKVKKQTDETAWTVWRPVLRLKLNIPCLW